MYRPPAPADHPMNAVVVQPAAVLLPDGVGGLADAAEAEGLRVVSTVIDRWVDGTQRFAAPGESLLIARADGEAIAIGGLAHCPNVAGALRVRRFYVHPSWRRRGVARTLVQQLIEGGLRHTDTLTCNARASAAAPPFWESLGFAAVDLEGITHVRHVSGG